MPAVIVFLFGLALGSFLNVCLHRLPKSQSVVRPRSRCPHCGHPIAWYDNVPLLSYLLLLGRCHHCHGRISPLYPAVELLTGLLFVFVYFRFGPTGAGLKAAWLSASLLALILTDLRDRLLPDAITLSGMVAGVLFALWPGVNDGTAARLAERAGVTIPWPQAAWLADALLGALVGAGLLYTLGWLWLKLRKVEALGFGDVKLMAMVGLFFGLQLTWLTLLVGSLLGSVVGGLFIWFAGKDSKYELPFGSFLGAAALLALFWGERLVAAYFDWFR